jgi:hypothetical protein
MPFLIFRFSDTIHAMATSRDDLLALLALKKQEFKDKWAKNTHAPSNHKRAVEDVPEQHDKSKS